MRNAQVFIMDAMPDSPLADLAGKHVAVTDGAVGEDAALADMPSFTHGDTVFRAKAYRVPATNVGGDPYPLVLGMARAEYQALVRKESVRQTAQRRADRARQHPPSAPRP